MQIPMKLGLFVRGQHQRAQGSAAQMGTMAHVLTAVFVVGIETELHAHRPWMQLLSANTQLIAPALSKMQSNHAAETMVRNGANQLNCYLSWLESGTGTKLQRKQVFQMDHQPSLDLEPVPSQSQFSTRFSL